MLSAPPTSARRVVDGIRQSIGHHGAWLIIVCVVIGGIPPAGAMLTITTTYHHNADGAVTSTIIDQGGGMSMVFYNTYDDFTPDPSNPTIGTVSTADGNLLAIGTIPGAADVAQFAYDQRDRLRACKAAGAPAVAYTYHPNSLMAASTLASSDTQQFYYGASPLVANTRQPSSGLVSSFLGPMRYVNDGTEQALLVPRKDTAAVYAPSGGTLAPYSYDPYGAPRSAPGASTGVSSTDERWDLSHNPFQYSDEYHDDACDAYYLRARWYLPRQQTFLTRDPVAGIQHYNYTGGNPIGRIDPSGLSDTGYRAYSAGVDRFMKKLGLGGTFLSAVPWIGPTMFLLQASAAGEFWHDRNAAATLAYMAVWGGAAFALELPAVDRLVGYSAAFRARLAGGTLIGATQALQAGFAGGHGRFDPTAAAESMAVTAGTILAGRFRLGIGYRYRVAGMMPEDVETLLMSRAGSVAGENPPVLVFRARFPRNELFALNTPLRPTAYDEALVGYQPVNVDGALAGRMEFTQVYSRSFGEERLQMSRVVSKSLVDRNGPVIDTRSRYELVGEYQPGDVGKAFRANPTGLKSYEEQKRFYRQNGYYDTSNQNEDNSHDHVEGILARLRQLNAQ